MIECQYCDMGYVISGGVVCLCDYCDGTGKVSDKTINTYNEEMYRLQVETEERRQEENRRQWAEYAEQENRRLEQQQEERRVRRSEE